MTIAPGPKNMDDLEQLGREKAIRESRDTPSGEVWPDYLMLRDTKLHDDLGGGGQRIYTTAGQGYKKVKYVRADLLPSETAHSPSAREDLASAAALAVVQERKGQYKGAYAVADFIMADSKSLSPSAREVAEKCAEICDEEHGHYSGAIAGAFADAAARIRAYAATLPTESAAPSEHNDELEQHPATDEVEEGNRFPGLTCEQKLKTMTIHARKLETALRGTQSATVGMAREERRVYHSSQEWQPYLDARFKEGVRTGGSFEWGGRRWRYEYSDFDERGDFDLLLGAAHPIDSSTHSHNGDQ